MGRRSGFLLPAVLAALLLALAVAGTRLWISRHHLGQTAHLADGERAWYLAASATAVAEALVGRAAAYVPARGGVPDELRPLVGLFVDGDGLPRRAPAEVVLRPAVLGYLAFAAGADALDLRVSLVPGAPLQDVEPPPPDDPRGAPFTVMARATAVVGNSRATVVAFAGARAVQILPGVLGKFALFLRGPGGRALNTLRASDDAPPPPCPLSVAAGAAVSRAAPLAPGELGRLLDRQGWIHLGGPAAWSLNVGHPGDEDSLLPLGTSLYELEPGSALAADGTLRYYTDALALSRELGQAASLAPLALLEPADYAETSLLRPEGPAAAPVPTVLVGDAWRRWALVQGLRNEGTGLRAPLPWLDEAAFAGDRWPGDPSPGTVARIRAHFGNDHARYARRMSDVVEEPWNVAHAELLPRPPGAVTSARLLPGGGPADLLGLVPSTALRIRDDAGEVLFDGDLDALRTASLAARARRRFRDQASLLAACRDQDGRFRVGGAVRLAGDLLLDQPLSLAPNGGGLVVIEGGLRIRAGVVGPLDEPLTLLALGGDAVVETEHPVHAGLVALTGALRLCPGADVLGFAAAGDLALPDGRARTVTWNPAFDATDRATRVRSWRLELDERWRSYVE